MNILRTPDEHFATLPDFPYAPNYADAHGLRMHYVAEGAGDPIVCLHGEPSWCYLYRKMIPVLAQAGRVIAPDLIGFGRSDKPTAREDYSYRMHFDSLIALVESLDLRNITLVCQDWGGLLGLPLATHLQGRFARLVIMNTGLPTTEEPTSESFFQWRAVSEQMLSAQISGIIQWGARTVLSDEVKAAYDAPFPDNSYKAGPFAFPWLVPTEPGDEAIPYLRECREKLRTWTKPALVLFSDKDPITRGGARFFRGLIPSAANQPEITIHGAGHFLQEDAGPEIAAHIVEFLRR